MKSLIKAVSEKCENKLKENNQEELFYNVELPLSKVLADMEYRGFKVSKESIEDYGIETEKKIEEIKENIFSQVGFEFNLNSPKQLGEALFEKLGLPAKKKTKSGYSTNAEVLEEYLF